MRTAFWTFLQISALLLFTGSLPCGLLTGRPDAGWIVFLAVLFLHIGELRVTIPLAKQRGFPVGSAVLKTMLFGFTWWVPFKHRPE